MTSLRCFVVLLLVLLLPVRGALAAAWSCPPAVTPHAAGHAHAAASAHGQGQQAGQDAHGDHAAPADHTAQPDADDCERCAAFCSATTLPSHFDNEVPRLDLPSASFPDVSAAAPSCIAEGHDRPPRST